MTKEKLIEQAGFSNTFESDRLGQLIDLVVAECIDAVKQTPRHHAYTTYDLAMVEATIERSVESIKTKLVDTNPAT